jgi:hypothetical protein
LERGTPQMTIWCMRFSRWIPKATKRHSQYVTPYAFLLQKNVARTQLNVKFIRTLPVLFCIHDNSQARSYVGSGRAVIAEVAFLSQACCCGRVQLKPDGTRCRTGGEVKGKMANGVGSQYSSHYLGTWCIQHYYRRCAHLGCQ